MIQCVSRALAWGILLKNPSNHCEHSCNDEVTNMYFDHLKAPTTLKWYYMEYL